jgi:ferrous iron transport protein B
MVIALNMQDEANRYGVRIDNQKLKEILKIPVIPTIALFGKGVKELIETCDQVISSGYPKPEFLKFTLHIEKSICEIQEDLKESHIPNKIDPRFYAIKLIENPQFVAKSLESLDRKKSELATEKIQIEHNTDGFEVIAYERHHHAMKITHLVSEIKQKKAQPFAEKLDSVLLHPFWGYFFLLLFFVVYFVVIFQVGNFISGLIEPPMQLLPPLYAPLKLFSPFLWFTFDGLFQGIAGALGIVLPYFLPLLILTSLFEDTGYMSRIAFLLDGFFHRIGLHGKSVAPFIMGFGCTVPALYATRIIENERDRLITGILINFIPCSARLTVIFAISSAFTGPFWTAFIFFFVLLIIAINGKILSYFFTKPTGLILEIPNLKLPSINSTIKKTQFKVKEFLKVAVPYLILGSIVLGWFEYFGASKIINYFFSPLITNVLGLPEQLGSTLIFGFLRKELLIVMASQAMGVQTFTQIGLTTVQALVFTIFIILYIPCVSTIAVFWKEFGPKTVLLTIIFSISIATLCGFLFKIILNI